VVAFAEAQLANLESRIPDEGGVQQRYPVFASSSNGGQFSVGSAESWLAGFYPALLWVAYSLTGRPEWKQAAEAKTLGLWSEAVSERAQDIGYKMIAFREAFELTGDPVYKRFMVRAADTFMGSIDKRSCAAAFATWRHKGSGGGGPTLVSPVYPSGLVNAALLMWGARQPEGSPAWRQRGLGHALATAQNQVRPDGSTYQIVDYDPSCPSRGWRWRGSDFGPDEGTRARAQANAMLGFAWAAREDSDGRLLEAARRTADFFLDTPTTPADGIPYWDLSLGPDADEPRDTSGAAMAASALLTLAGDLRIDEAARARYRTRAVAIVSSLARRYLAREQREGIVDQSFFQPRPGQTRASLPSTDYFFLDSIRRLLGRRGVICRGPVCELEAESGNLEPGFEVEADLPPRIVQRADGGHARYTFHLPVAGRYRLETVVDVPAPGASLFLDLDGEPGAESGWSLLPTGGFAARMAPGERALAPGPHTLVLRGGRGALAIDKIRLCRQTRILEDFSTRSRRLSAGSAAGGVLEVVAPASLPTGARGSPRAVAVHEVEVVPPFDLTVKVRLRSRRDDADPTAPNPAPGAALAILFGYQDPASYDFLALTEAADLYPSGLYRMSKGEVIRLAPGAPPLDDERWYLVTIHRTRDLVRVSLNGVPVLSAPDDRLGPGRIALAAGVGTALFDDLVVE
jgi:hypothetical protein